MKNNNTNNEFNRSPFFYVGDKFKLLPQLRENFPKNIERLVEPFCGGGSVFLNTPAKEYVLNDIDSNMVSLHQFLISYSKNETDFWTKIENIIKQYNLSATYKGTVIPQELRAEYPKTYFAKYNKEAYTTLRNDYNANKDDLMKLYILLIYGFNRMLRFNAKGDFNLPVGNVDFNDNVVKALNAYFSYVKDKKIQFYNMDFEAFLDSLELNENDFVYLDPPYLITFSEYNKLWDEDCEMRLIKVLDKLHEKGIKFAVSNVLWHRKKYNGTFNMWAQKYNIVRVKSNYISFNDNTDKDTYEVLVKNYWG